MQPSKKRVIEFADTALNKVETLQRKAYLDSKGINPQKAMQLDLIFAQTMGQRDDLRHIPNEFARSSLFTARSRKMPRRILSQETLFHYNESISILYTGLELRAEDDELIWLQILNYGQGVPLGDPFDFSIKDLVRDVNWSKNGQNYNRARACISRLKANEILTLNTKAYGKSGSVSLIQNYIVTNDADGTPIDYRVWIDRNLIVLFAGNTFTSHKWKVYRSLAPVSRRLADYIESHRHPFPLTIEKFRHICGSQNTALRSWKQTVKKACAEIERTKIARKIYLTDENTIYFVRD